MILRFSKKGPIFPKEFVDGLSSGNVIFLCGAGVSAPQLPGFDLLVSQCFDRLRMNMSPSERQSFEEKRFEEVLGSLSRRLVRPAILHEAIKNLLKTPETYNLSHHQTILRLSRDIENRPAIVTTNFDTLFEQACFDLKDRDSGQSPSFAGQDLPLPGSASFRGIIHLHGRIADDSLGLDDTPLVVTSAEYGDAYMRSGWASRFLFDLCRCKTIVLIGYSAGDAPVRYFLNVLDADRRRFPDLHRVFAFTDVVKHGDPDTRWEALAVTPIPYEISIDDQTSNMSFDILWQDLEKLADLIERPRETRCDWVNSILCNALSGTTEDDINHVMWLLDGRSDVWKSVIDTIEDEGWLKFFWERKLWSDQTVAAGFVAAWIARDFQSPARFRLAVEWLGRLGDDFAVAIGRKIQNAQGLSDFWFRAWSLFSRSSRKNDLQHNQSVYLTTKNLGRAVVLNSDVNKAIELLTPSLELRPRVSGFYKGAIAPPVPDRISDLAWARLCTSEGPMMDELLETLVSKPNAFEILMIATGRLQAVLSIAIDIEAIKDEHDYIETNVPSVEPHPQNEHRDGVIYIVQILARMLPTSAVNNRMGTRGLVELWRELPGLIGVRLWLHSLRNTSLFTSDEAIQELINLPVAIFWRLRRELALALRERVCDANEVLINKIEQRVLHEADTYYNQFSIDPEQIDWRPHARDAAVWLRLNMLAESNQLSTAGLEELAAIKARRGHLNRNVIDQDFFSSYSTGVRSVVGDPKPIISAATSERLMVAQEAIQSPYSEEQRGWFVYCGIDPSGAWETLRVAPVNEANAPLWSEFMESLAFRNDEKDFAYGQITDDIFTALEPVSDDILTLIVGPLTVLYCRRMSYESPIFIRWWIRLFYLAEESEDSLSDASEGIIESAINSLSGRLTEVALHAVEQSRQSPLGINENLLSILERAALAKGIAGCFARIVLVASAEFVLSLKQQKIKNALEESFTGTNRDAIGLRSVLVEFGQVGPETSRTFRTHILQGLVELDPKVNSVAVAAKILKPALAIVLEEKNAASWGISLADIVPVLRDGPTILRVGVANLLTQWSPEISGGGARGWRTGVFPLLSRIWPVDAALRTKELTSHFIVLAVNAGEAFPEALEWLLPYFTEIDSQFSFYQLEKSTVPEQFPNETLKLLWSLCDLNGSLPIYGVQKILDRLRLSEPLLEVDRRFQRLSQNAENFG